MEMEKRACKKGPDLQKWHVSLSSVMYRKSCPGEKREWQLSLPNGSPVPFLLSIPRSGEGQKLLSRPAGFWLWCQL
jgi:hypothetical protein